MCTYGNRVFDPVLKSLFGECVKFKDSVRLYMLLIVNSQYWEAESLSDVGGKHVDGGLISV